MATICSAFFDIHISYVIIIMYVILIWKKKKSSSQTDIIASSHIRLLSMSKQISIKSMSKHEQCYHHEISKQNVMKNKLTGGKEEENL